MPGLIPRKYKDHRRYSFPRTFGTTTQLTDIDLDKNLWNPNQNEPEPIFGNPGYPNGCSYYTRADIAANEDGILYDPRFVGNKACLIEGVPFGSPLPLEASFKAGVVYGLEAKGETEQEALTHRRGPYFEVHPVNGQDYFDALWSALCVGRRPISVGTQWFQALSNGNGDNFVPMQTNDWHNWEALGVITTDQPRLKVKWWGGPIVYFNRQTVNNLMAVKGTDALADVDGKATPQDIQTVKLNIIEVLTSLMQRLLSTYQNQLKQGALELTPNFMNPDLYTYPWDTPAHNWHNVRVLCDNAGLTVEQKNLICACLYQESEFYNYKPNGQPTQCLNKDKTGAVWSIDWGICQVNDWFHIGTGKDFPSTDYVMSNPDKVVEWMIGKYKAGELSQWSSYSTGAYKHWLSPSSPMWKLIGG